MPDAQGVPVQTPAMESWRRLTFAQQAGGRVPQRWQEEIERDPMLRQAVMVVELWFGGRQLLLSTVPVRAVSGLDGSVHATAATLIEEPSLTQDYSLGDGTSSARSLPFTVSTEVIDPAGLIADGGVLAGQAEVSLLVDGMDWDHRYVLLRGDVSGGVSFGARTATTHGEVVELEVVDPKESMQVVLPPWVVDADTGGRFDSFSPHASAVGDRIPLVFNRYTAIPAVRVHDAAGNRQFMFAHEHGWTVSTVYVNGESKLAADAFYAWALTERTDDFGVPFSVVRFTRVPTVWEDSDAVNVSAISSRTRGVLEIVRYIVETFSPMGVDLAHAELFATASTRFGLRVARALVNASSGGGATSALGWIEIGFLSSFPMVSMVWEGGRYGPVITDRRAPLVTELVAGEYPLLDRISDVRESDKGELWNEWTLRYDYDPMQDVYAKVATRNPSNSALCEVSRALIGDRVRDPIESPHVYTDDVAAYVLDWLVEHFALPSYVVQYEASPILLLRLRRGDTLALTDADFGWTRLRATVEAISYARGRCELTLRVWAALFDLGGQARSFGRDV